MRDSPSGRGPGPRSIILQLAALALAGLGSSSAQTAAPADFRIEHVEFQGVNYQVVRAAPERVRLLWQDEEGKGLRTFEKARDHLERQGEQALMITSGGVFEGDGNPMGLHVEDGEERKGLNLGSGEGNFFIKPNGVFLVREGEEGRRALIWSSNTYSAWLKVRKDRRSLPVYAMQSGPMLVVRGMRNFRLDPESESRMARNGVGIDAGGRVVFAITGRNETVNLHDFAELFLSLGCKDALYLNGDIPQMVLNPRGRISSHGFGSILAVVAPLREEVLAGERTR